MTNLEKYYNKFHEEHRLQTRHGLVEFNTTLHFIEESITELKKQEPNLSQIKIADIGAGTGRYSVELCHRGYDVTAVELVKHNLEILRSKHENIKTWQSNAQDLHFLEDETFDITLLFGPLYHLHGDENKLKALNEAKRITKKGGIILVAYVMNDYSVIQYCFREHHWQEVSAKNGLTPDFHTICTQEDLYDYVRLEDINRLNQGAKLKRLKIISADGPSDFFRRELNEMSLEEFQAFLQYHLANCQRPELVGAGSHTVDILQKEQF
ncbi:MAG: class I SAM-dependent methyltransferase [Treponema sp.]|nr:class I SAM-dependent methyltransferase [Treponema sp.]